MPKTSLSSISSDQQLAVAIDELAELFVLFDAQDRIIIANKAWRDLNKDIPEFCQPGISFEAHLRAAIANNLIPEAQGREEAWLQERLDRHFNPRGVFQIQRQDGRWISVHEQRLPNNGTVLIISDITTHKRVNEELRASEERFQAFIKNLPAKMHIKDTEGRYLLINPVSEQLFGISNADAIGKTAIDIFPHRQGESFNAHDKEVLNTGTASMQEEIFHTPDGELTFLTVKFPIRDAEGNICAVGASGIDITDRKHIDDLLRSREQQLKSVVDSAPYYIARFGTDCRARFANRLLEKTLGLGDNEFIGKTPLERKKPGAVGIENYQAMMQKVIETGKREDVEVIQPMEGGEPRVHRVTIVAERNRDGEIIGAITFGRDITETKKAEEDLRIAAIAMDSQEAIAITDANGAIIKINHAFTRITGYTAEDALGKTMPKLLKSGEHKTAFYDTMYERLDREDYWEGEIRNRNKHGEVFPHRLNITAVRNNDNQITHYVTAFTDITQQKEAEEIIHNLAFFDPLTELPNRRLLQDRLEHTLATSARNHRHGAILFIDLDHFKELNDTRGHGVGDMLLVEVARRLLTCVREDDTVARLGGDEFVIVLNDLNQGTDQAAIQAETIAEKMRDAITRPFELQGHEYRTSPSIGICLFRGDEINAMELLKRADTAMYQAKQSGRNAIRFFDPATHAAMEARIKLEVDLRSAIAEEQLRLVYQMQVDQRGDIIGAEALLRWHHPQRGLVLPHQFITLAEETGLILSIGHWVLVAACKQLKRWALDPVTQHLQLAINVSASQFHQSNFVEQINTVLNQTGVDPLKLKLELTESMILDNIEETIAKMHALKEAGIQFSMDDFGTGHSALAYLTQLPFDQLKIDQSFVRNMNVKGSDAVIIQTIIGMARNLGMEIIAEGVETLEQRDQLEQWGCLHFQGYLFGKPVPDYEFEHCLTSKKMMFSRK